MQTSTRKNPQLKVTLDEASRALLDELAKGIGCSRSAVAAYVLRAGVGSLASIPSRKRKAIIKEGRGMLYGSEVAIAGAAAGARSQAEALKALRARGVSANYIEAVLGSLVEYGLGMPQDEFFFGDAP